jgi:N-acetylmuramoyl-L-alanine amidase
VQIVTLAAFALATLFTAWTDPEILPANFLNGLASVSPNQPTPSSGEKLPTSRARPLIGLVAGHKGNDSGAVCPDGLTEQSVNEKIAYLVQKILVEKGYDTDVLNEFDPKLDGYLATVLVSIHADSCEYINDQASGFKVSSALANPHPERAARLTACLKNRYARTTGLTLHNSITTDMTSYHAFAEIDPETTAAIIEVGFLNLDRQILTQKADLVAQGIADGILCYLNNEDLSQDTPAP